MKPREYKRYSYDSTHMRGAAHVRKSDKQNLIIKYNADVRCNWLVPESMWETVKCTQKDAGRQNLFHHYRAFRNTTKD